VRTMLRLRFPVEKGNKTVKEGSLPKTFNKFAERFEPEAAYFYSDEGRRAATFVFDLPESDDIPTIAEMFFQEVDAEVWLTPVMNLEDLKAGLTKMKR